MGDVWIADETMLDVDGQHKVWFYDIIDRDTRFLLASRAAIARTTNDAERLMELAAKRTGKRPKEVLTDQNNSYMTGKLIHLLARNRPESQNQVYPAQRSSLPPLHFAFRVTDS